MYSLPASLFRPGKTHHLSMSRTKCHLSYVRLILIWLYIRRLHVLFCRMQYRYIYLCPSLSYPHRAQMKSVMRLCLLCFLLLLNPCRISLCVRRLQRISCRDYLLPGIQIHPLRLWRPNNAHKSSQMSRR